MLSSSRLFNKKEEESENKLFKDVRKNYVKDDEGNIKDLEVIIDPLVKQLERKRNLSAAEKILFKQIGTSRFSMVVAPKNKIERHIEPADKTREGLTLENTTHSPIANKSISTKFYLPKSNSMKKLKASEKASGAANAGLLLFKMHNMTDKQKNGFRHREINYLSNKR